MLYSLLFHSCATTSSRRPAHGRNRARRPEGSCSSRRTGTRTLRNAVALATHAIHAGCLRQSSRTAFYVSHPLHDVVLHAEALRSATRQCLRSSGRRSRRDGDGDAFGSWSARGTAAGKAGNGFTQSPTQQTPAQLQQLQLQQQ
jgi:hypothetical protein